MRAIMSQEDALRIEFDNASNGILANNVQDVITELTHRYPYASTATTLNGTIILTVASRIAQYFTGSATGFSIELPNATLLPNEWRHDLINTTPQPINVKDSSGAVLFVLSQYSVGFIRLQSNSTSTGLWVYWQVLASSTASGIVNYNLTSAVPFITTSLVDVAIPSFSLTAQAGTYLVLYNAAVFVTQSGQFNYTTIYKNSSAIIESERELRAASSNSRMTQATMAIVQVNGTDTINVRVRETGSGDLTINSRTLILIRLGP